MIFLLEVVVVVGSLVLGVRAGGVATGFWAGAGTAVLVLGFRENVESAPIAVILIAIAVISAGAALDASGGLGYITRIAARFLRSHPDHPNLMAPLVVFVLVMFAGTAFITVALIPAIASIAIDHKIRPSRPLGGALAAASVAIVASPVSAATAVSVGFLAEENVSLGQILTVTIPAGLIGVLAMGTWLYVMSRRTAWEPPAAERELSAEANARLADETSDLPVGTRRAVVIFAIGVVAVILCGSFSQLRPEVTVDGETSRMALTALLPLIMFAVGALIMLFCRVEARSVMEAPTFRAGFVAIVALIGVSTLAATFVGGNEEYLVNPLKELANGGVILLAVVIALLAAVTSSQAATLSAILPVALPAGVAPSVMVGVLPATGGNGLLPINGYEYVCVEMDTTESTKVGRWIVNHFAFLPSLAATTVATCVGLAIAAVTLG